MEGDYLYGFMLLSTIILVMIPPIVIGFGQTPEVNESPIANVISTIINGVVWFIGFMIKMVIFVIKWVTLGFLYMVDGLTLSSIDEIANAKVQVTNLFNGITEYISGIVDAFQEFIEDAILSYTLIPVPVMLILLLPYAFVIFTAYVHP